MPEFAPLTFTCPGPTIRPVEAGITKLSSPVVRLRLMAALAISRDPFCSSRALGTPTPLVGPLSVKLLLNVNLGVLLVPLFITIR
jgi:hypothetical protein